MEPINNPETLGQGNFRPPSEDPPPYSATTSEWKERDPVYFPYGAPAADTNAWKISPMHTQENTNTSLASDYHKNSVPYDLLTSKCNTSNEDVSTSFLSTESVTHVEPVKEEKSLGFNVTSHESPAFSRPLTSEGVSLPYPILPQTMSSSSEVKSSGFPLPPTETAPSAPSYTTGY